MEYKTQMEAAKKGFVTPQMKVVADQEKIDVAVLMARMAKGEVVIPANKNHKNLAPAAIGRGMRTKINVNLGVSNDCCQQDLELEKAKLAVEMKAEAIMDLSCFGQTRAFRKRLIEESPAVIGTVPMYDAVGFHHGHEFVDLTAEDFLNVVRAHAEDGVDFMTIHAGINRSTAERVKKTKRITNIVSRGGSLLFAWMEMNNTENPFYEHYDELLEICREYDVTISLGDACRPGCVNDATDACQIEELIVLGELTLRAWEKDVQVMIEGPGHMAINEIVANIQLAKKLTHNAPLYVLGPLVTDIAPGYDHITSAIGGALAASVGVDFLCYVTPAEHLRLPSLDDVREGIIASRIAAHAGDLAKGVTGAIEQDNAMSHARAAIDYETMFKYAIDPVKAREYRGSAQPAEKDTCTMCGRMCAMRTMNKILAGEKISLKE